MAKQPDSLESLSIKAILKSSDDGKFILRLPIPAKWKEQLKQRHKLQCEEIVVEWWTVAVSDKKICTSCRSPRWWRNPTIQFGRYPEYLFEIHKRYLPHVQSYKRRRILFNYLCFVCCEPCILVKSECGCFDSVED